jgi:hypothetical protein
MLGPQAVLHTDELLEVLHTHGGGTLQVASVRHLQQEQASLFGSWDEESKTDNGQGTLVSPSFHICHLPCWPNLQTQMTVALGIYTKC